MLWREIIKPNTQQQTMQKQCSKYRIGTWINVSGSIHPCYQLKNKHNNYEKYNLQNVSVKVIKFKLILMQFVKSWSLRWTKNFLVLLISHMYMEGQKIKFEFFV